MDHYAELTLAGTKIRLSLDDDLQQAKALWQSSDHNHAAWELHILLHGTCRVDMDRASMKISAHEALLIAPGQYHRAKSAQGDFERFSMTFTAEEGALLQSLQAAVPCCKVYPVTTEIEDLCRSIFHERCGNGPFRRTALHSLISLLLIRNLNLLQIADPDTHSAPPAPRKYTELIDAFFETHTSDHITTDDLADELHLSRTHVNRILKKHYGVTFREKLIRTRMTRAAWLLRHTDRRLDHIAEEVGYRSMSAFHEMFRKQFGTTPEQYRQQIR